MDAESFAIGAEVVRRAERVREDEHTPLGPPERYLLPEAPRVDRNELELRDRSTRNDVIRDAEPRGQRRTITIVTIEQLDDAGGGSRRANPILEFVPVERVDQPDAAVRDECMGAAP